MTTLSIVPSTLRVAILDCGTDGATAALRKLLAGTRLVELTSVATARDDSRAEGLRVHIAADVVVLVWGDGAELAAAISSARRMATDAAVVVIMPSYDDALLLTAIRLGAEDCIPAPALESESLLRVLLIAAERHRATSSLRAAAYTDELTGLYNRRGYVTRAAALLKVADPKTIWQIFFDVDELKTINDTYGHWAGDRALMEVAAVLRQAFRSTDIVARVGGDEFAVLAVAPVDAAPDSWTARWREPLAVLATRRDLPLSVSVGLAQPDEHGQMTPDELLARADTTMYTAKRLRKKLADGARARVSGPVAVG
jgi:diguanylate cyclase (GGDEF)-like protein